MAITKLPVTKLGLCQRKSNKTQDLKTWYRVPDVWGIHLVETWFQVFAAFSFLTKFILS